MITGFVMSVPKSHDYITHRHMGRMYVLNGCSDSSFRVYLSGRNNEVGEDDDIRLVLKDLISNLVKTHRGKFETEKYWYEIFSVYDNCVFKPFCS